MCVLLSHKWLCVLHCFSNIITLSWLINNFLSSSSLDTFNDAEDNIDRHEDHLCHETKKAIGNNVVHEHFVPFILLLDTPILFLRENAKCHQACKIELCVNEQKSILKSIEQLKKTNKSKYALENKYNDPKIQWRDKSCEED